MDCAWPPTTCPPGGPHAGVHAARGRPTCDMIPYISAMIPYITDMILYITDMIPYITAIK